MAKQLNVNLSMTADINQAKGQLQQLQKTFTNLINTASQKSSLGLTDEISKAINSATELKIALQNATTSTGKLDLGQFSQSLKKNNKELVDYANDLKALGPQGAQAFAQVTRAINSADVPLKKVNGLLSEFATTLKNTARWQLSSSILHGFMGTLQGAYGYAQDLNESLNNIRIVTGQTTEEMAAFSEKANKAAQALSTTTTAYTEAALIFYQQGLDDQAVEERTNAVIKMSNVTGDSASEVSSYMTAIWNNFDNGSESLEHYADVITALGASTASSSAEIAAGLEKFASVAETIGLSYEYSTAALATIVANTRQSAETVGTGLRTIFSRLQGLSLGETLEDGTDLNKYSKALKTVGVDVLDASGNLKNMDIILTDLAGKWNTLSQAQQTALAQTVGGVRQYTNLIALMNNWGDMEENLQTANQSDGSLQSQANIYAEGWEAARDRVKAASQAIYQDLLDDQAFVNILNIVEKLLQSIDLLIDSFGGLGSMLPLLGSALLSIFGSDLSSSIDNMIYNIQLGTEKGIQNTIELRQKANQALRDMMDTGNADDSAVATIFQSQADAQDRLIEKTVQIEAAGGRISEQDLQRVQSAMDLQQALGDEYIQLVKNKEAQEAILKSQIRQAQYAMKKSGKSNDFKEKVQQAKELEKQYQILTRIKTIFDKAGTDRESDGFKQAIEWVQKYIKALEDTGALGETSIKKVSQAIQDIINPSSDAKEAINALGTTIEAVGADAFTAFESAEQMMVDAKVAPAEAQKAMQGMINTADQIAASTDQVIQGFSDVTTQGQNVGDAIDNINAESATMGEAFTDVASAAMSFGMALSSISNFGEDLFDKDVSIIQKIISGFMALSMAVKTYSAIREAQKTLDEAILALKAKHEAATLREVIAEKAHAAAISAKALAEQFSNTVKVAAYSITHKCTMAKAAEALGINLVTAATVAETGAVEANTVAWYSNPILAVVAVALLAVVAVVKAVSSAMEANSKAIAENAEKAREQAQASKEQADAEKELTDEYEKQYDAYKKAKEAGEDTAEIKADLDQAARELAKAYEEEHGRLQDVNTELLIAQENYAKLTEEIRGHQRALVDKALTDNAVARANTAKEFENTMRDDDGRFELGGSTYKVDFGNGTDLVSQFGKNDDEYWIGQAFNKNKDALSLMTKNQYGDGDINLETAGRNTQDLIQAYEQVQLLVNETARMAAEAGPEALNSLNDSEIYQNMVQWLKKSSEQYEALIALQKEYQDLKVQEIILDAQNGIDLNAINSYEEYEEAQSKAVSSLTEALIAQGVAEDEAAEKAFNAVNAYMAANEHLTQYANTAKAASQAINEAVSPDDDGNESFWADKKEELQNFYNSLDYDQKSVFFNLNFDIAKSTDDLTAQLNMLQQVADANEIKTNLSVVNQAADMLANDGPEALKNSGINWGDQTEGIIEFDDFLKKSKAEQIEYLSELSKNYANKLKEESKQAIEAIGSEMKAIQGQIDNLGTPDVNWSEEQLAYYNSLNEELKKLEQQKKELSAEPESFSSIETLMKMIKDIDNDVEKINLLKQVWNGNAESAQEYNQALLEILENSSQLTDNEKLGIILSTQWDEATKASSEYKRSIIDILSSTDVNLNLNQKMALIGDTIKGGVEDAIQYGDTIAKIITSDEKSTTEEKLRALETTLQHSAMTAEDFSNAVSRIIDNKEMSMELLLNFSDLYNYNEKVKELASNYSFCASAVEKYNEALRSGNQSQIDAAASEMELNTWIAQAADQYNMNADRIKIMADMYMAQAEAFDSVLNKGASAAELATDLAIRNLRLNDAVEDLSTNWDDYNKILEMVNNSAYESIDAIKAEIAQSEKLSKTFTSLKSSVAGLLNVSEDMFKDDFIIKNMDKIKRAAKGDEEALKELQKAASEQIVIDLDNKGVLEKLGTTADELNNWLNNLPEGELGLDDTAYLQKLVDAMQAAGMAQAEIENALKAMCIDVDLAPYEDALQHAVDTAAEAGTLASDSFASNAGVDTEVKTETSEDQDTKEVIGWDAVASSIPISGSVPNIQPSRFGGVVVNGNIPLSGSFPTVDVNPTKSTDTESKTTTATALEVKGATKTSGGHLSRSNKSGGTKKSGGGGGGGKTSAPKAKPKDHKTRHEIRNDYKSVKQDLDRYHEIENTLDDINDNIDKYNSISSRAFGGKKVKALQEEAKALKQSAKAYDEYLKEIKGYLKTDIADAKSHGWTFDSEGNVDNYDEQMKKLIAEQNAAQDRYLSEYNAAVDWWNSLSAEQQNDETYSSRFEDMTEAAQVNLDLANDAYKDAVDALKKYEETKELQEEKEKARREALEKALDAELEAIDAIVQVKIQIEDNDLKYLKELLEQCGDSADRAADAIALMGSEITSIGSKANAYKEGILNILTPYTDKELLGENALSQNLINKILSGGAIDDDDRADLINAGITEETINKLQSYQDGLLDVNTELRSLRTEAVEKASAAFSEFTSELDKNAERIAHLQKVAQTYKDVIDIVGRKMLDASGELTKRLDRANFEMQRNNTSALKSELDFIDQSIAAQKQTIAKLEADNTGGQHDESIKAMKQQLQDMTDTRNSTYESWLDSWQAECQSAADIYSDTLVTIVDNFTDAVAGAFGSLDSLSEEFSRRQDIANMYLSDYQQIYNLSKLTRDINKSIDETDNVKSKKALKDLMEDIERMQENGVKLSQYDLDNLQKQYELELAKQQLSEAQDAKTEVRMTKDSEGNYGYVYTADANSVADAEQNYEDKLYAMQSANADYINNLQSNIIQAEQDCANALSSLDASQFASYEKYQEAVARVQADYSEKLDGYYQQMENVLGNNKYLYDTEWMAYSEMTGYKISADQDYIDSFEETTYSLLTGFQDIQSAQTEWSNAIANAVNEACAAYYQWFKDTELAMADGETSLQDFSETVEEVADTTVGSSEKMAEAAKDLAEDYTGAYAEIMSALDNFCEQYDAKIQKIINSNTDLVKSINSVIKASADVETNSSTDSVSPSATSASSTSADWNRVKQAYQNNLDENGQFVGSPANNSKFTKEEMRFAAELDRLIKDGKTMEQAKKLLNFDTGGYTGKWNSQEGKLAMLHQKELVLNSTDTENLLKAIDLIRTISKTIDLNALSASSGLASLLNSSSTVTTEKEELQQNITITAEFPNATNHSEIEQAFENLANRAAQFANRKN